jgi:hypothetical protein
MGNSYSDVMKIDIDLVEVAIVRNGGCKLGNCYYQNNFLVYVSKNPDLDIWDTIAAAAGLPTSVQRRDQLLMMLPAANAGVWLGKFEKVDGSIDTYVASAYVKIDSSD